MAIKNTGLFSSGRCRSHSSIPLRLYCKLGILTVFFSCSQQNLLKRKPLVFSDQVIECNFCKMYFFTKTDFDNLSAFLFFRLRFVHLWNTSTRLISRGIFRVIWESALHKSYQSLGQNWKYDEPHENFFHKDVLFAESDFNGTSMPKHAFWLMKNGLVILF